MRRKAIAHGVEDVATADALSRIGVDYVQGCWIAYPKELR